MNRTIAIFLVLAADFFPGPVSGKGKIKVACIGNSVTYGYTLEDPATESYPAVLQRSLGDGYDVENFGHSGATLLRHGHNPYYLTPEFTRAVRFAADIAVIDLGLNDTDPRDWPGYRDDFIGDYGWLIDTLRKTSPHIRIYICTLTPVFTGHPRFMSSTLSWYRQVERLIPVISTQWHTGLIDLYGALFDRPDLFTDPPTLHPNREGAAALAGIVYRYLTGDYGGLRVADIFSDHMVLQQGRPVPVWGTADAGTAVHVEFANVTRDTVTGADGCWQVTLPAQKTSATPRTLTVENAGTRIRFTDVLCGDVWLCSGQSNMYFPLNEARGGDTIAKQASVATPLRLFKYSPYAETDATPWDSVALQKANDLEFFSGRWQPNRPRAASEFSAVGYVFARRLEQATGIPVGVIELAVGGSPLISWLDRATLESDPLFEPALHDWRRSDYLMGWCRERADLNLKYATSPFQRYSYEPCYNFEAGVARITRFPIRGVVWYQGESDADNPELYRKLFPLLVSDWRGQWGYPFPFYYVQLSSIDRPSWNHFRNMQRELLTQVPHSGMVVTSDLGDSLNVHYPDKRPVGLRLARLALHDTYGKHRVVCQGPLVTVAPERVDHITVYFSGAEGLRTSDGKPPRGFAVMSVRGQILPVKARITADSMRLDIPSGVTVRRVMYAWKPFTRANLVNGAGLPASTFMVRPHPAGGGIQTPKTALEIRSGNSKDVPRGEPSKTLDR
jgi:sialate O-acetylesterase